MPVIDFCRTVNPQKIKIQRGDANLSKRDI
jgi:hypothetical protein